MNDIQQLIDRYLAEGLSSDELARLSHAVHRDDAPAEWLIIREMIDTLTEGEDDYDLILAARESGTESAAQVSTPAVARQSAAKAKTAIPFLRSTWFRNIAAASAILIAIVGSALYFTNERDLQIAEVDKGYLAPSDSPALSPVASIDKTSVDPNSEEPSVSVPATTASATPAAEAPAPHALPTARSTNHHREIAAAPKADDASQQDETQPADTPVDVPERRIYSYNLLDQVSDYYDSPAPDDY